jgi:hypothetical protein
MNVLMFTIYLRWVVGSVTASAYTAERARPRIGCTGMQTADMPSVARGEGPVPSIVDAGTNASSALRAPSGLRLAIVKEAHNASSISAAAARFVHITLTPNGSPARQGLSPPASQQLHTQQCHRDT